MARTEQKMDSLEESNGKYQELEGPGEAEKLMRKVSFYETEQNVYNKHFKTDAGKQIYEYFYRKIKVAVLIYFICGKNCYKS